MQEVKAQLDFSNAHLMEAICTARSLERLVGELLKISMKDWQHSPAASRRIQDLRKHFQKQISSIVKGTRWPSCINSKPAILAKQLWKLDAKKQHADPTQQLQEALQDNHMLLEQLATEQQRNAKVEEELRRTCDRERRMEDHLNDYVEWVKQIRVADEAATAQPMNQIRVEEKTAAAQRLEQVRAEAETAAAAAAQRQEELVRQAAAAQQEVSRLQRLAADQAAQIAALEQQAAAAEQAKANAQHRFAVLAESGSAQNKQITKVNEQVGQLSLQLGAAEQLNKELQQENNELQEALERLGWAGCEASEPGTPTQRISSSRSMFSCVDMCSG